MLLSIIIVSYNTQALTTEAITSADKDLAASKLLKGESEIILVDNHSTDGTVAEARKLKKELKTPFTIIANDRNTGFASANNQGIEQANGKYLLLLNSDTIVHDGAIEQLVKTFEAHPVNEQTSELASAMGTIDRLGILAATLLNLDGSLQAQGGSFPTLVSLATHWLMLDDIPFIGRLLPSTQHTGKNTRQTFGDTGLIQQDWVGGAAMMIRKEMLDDIGLLDSNIFMYAEDVEFCLRARKHHWDVAIDPQARITHYGSASSSLLNALRGEARGYVYIWSKHQPLWQLPLAKAIMSLGCQLRIWIFGKMKGDRDKAEIYASIKQDLKRS